MATMHGVTSSGSKTADAQICSTGRECFLHTIFLDPPSAGTATLTIYDSENSTVSGKNVLAYVESFSTDDSSQVYHLTTPVNTNKGIYAVFTGTGATYQVHFSI